jgi:adenine phosphoribosyltransferase
MTNDLIRVITDFPKPGIIFKDITPLLADAKALNDCCEKIALYAKDADYIAGIEVKVSFQ